MCLLAMLGRLRETNTKLWAQCQAQKAANGAKKDLSPSFYLGSLGPVSRVGRLLPACPGAGIRGRRGRGKSVGNMRAGAASLLP